MTSWSVLTGLNIQGVVLSVAVGVIAMPPVRSGPHRTDDPLLSVLVQRFLDRSEERVSSYRVLRHLEAHNDRYKKHGWIEAWTTLDPENGFSFRVVSEGGSSYIRDRVLRKALEREADAYRRGETGAAALATANYRFSDEARDGAGVTRVAMTALRQDPLLVNGAIYLTDADADLVRLEGLLAKSPSFWTRQVHVTRRYGRVAGIRVPLALESTAQVVVAGTSTFEMRYEYESVNGRPVGLPVSGSDNPPSSLPTSDIGPGTLRPPCAQPDCPR